MSCKLCGPLRPGAWIAIAAAIIAGISAQSSGQDRSEQPAPAAAVSKPFTVEVTGEGPPVFLIPGLNSSAEVWEGTIEALKSDYQLHVFTLAGFGGTDPLEGPFLDPVTEGLVSYAEEKKLEKPVVVGHSMGAFLGYKLALAAPEAFGAVVAVDGVPFLPALLQPGASVDSVRPMAESLRQSLPAMSEEQRMAQAQAQLARFAQGEEAQGLVLSMAAASAPEATAQAMYEVMTTDLRSDVKGIRVPVLLYAAAGFAGSPEEKEGVRSRYESQVSAIPDHRILLAEDALHFVMLDDPSFFHSTLEAFLGEVTGEAP